MCVLIFQVSPILLSGLWYRFSSDKTARLFKQENFDIISSAGLEVPNLSVNELSADFVANFESNAFQKAKT